MDLGTLERASKAPQPPSTSSGDIVGPEHRSSPLRLPRPFYATMWRRQQRDDWTFCAPEGGVCAFTGTTEVRYGANGSFVYRTLTDGTACTNEVFGDPIYGTVKAMRDQEHAAADRVDVLRAGGRRVRLHRHEEVRYGANGAFVYRTLTDGTACTNEVFGDPIYGTVKQCAIRIPPPPTEWTFCAPEGGVCAFTGTSGGALRGERRVCLPDVDRRHRVYQRGVRRPDLRRGQGLQSANRLTIATAAIESYAGYEPKRWPEGCSRRAGGVVAC